MGRLKRSKKAGSPPSPARGSKLPNSAKRTESPPEMRTKQHLLQSRAKAIMGHLRAAGNRAQAKRDKG